MSIVIILPILALVSTAQGLDPDEGDRGDIQGYDTHIGMFLDGYDDKNVPGLTNKQECADACEEWSKCQSFDWSPENRLCYLSKESAVTKKEDLVKHVAWGHYVHRKRAVAYCPDGALIDEYTKRCFKINPKALSWKDAEKACKKDGDGLLIVFPDRMAGRNIRRLVDAAGVKIPDEYWSALTWRDDQWKWSWGKRDIKLREHYFLDWTDGEPSGKAKQRCMAVSDEYAYEWFEAECSARKPSICEYRPKGDNLVYDYCPEDWLHYERRCYHLVTAGKGYTHADAQSVCDHRGADISSITLSEESDFTTAYLNEEMVKGDFDVWLGLDKLNDKEEWEWEDRSANYKKDFKNWKSGNDKAPDDIDCAVLTRVGVDKFAWQARSCDEIHNVLCEGLPDNARPTDCENGRLVCPENSQCKDGPEGSKCDCLKGYEEDEDQRGFACKAVKN